LRSFAGDYKTRRGKVIPEADLLRELHLVTSSGQVFRGYYACRRIAAALPAFWILLPLLYLPGSAVVGTPLYAWVADHRTLLSGLLAHTHLCHAAPLSQGQEAFQPPA
jgi:predicted DCC family thiol-disulfide oxidoreductase YuxK